MFRNEPARMEPTKAPVKSELQVIRLSEQSKTDIMDTLRHIHGQTFQLGNKSNYKEMGNRFKHTYWEERGNLVVQSAIDFSRIEKSGCDITDRKKITNLSKLESYGFDPAHCIEALECCGNDVDHAIELLYRQYFPMIFKLAETTKTDINENELNEMRSDEMAALQSIYDENVIEETESNKVWVLKLKIDHLLIYSEYEQKKRSLLELEEKKRKKYGVGSMKSMAKCRNFVASGKCKYGNKCRYSHDIETNKVMIDPNLDTNWFYLEFRFSNGNRYPYEMPMIALKTICPDISKTLCLRITRRCLEEAQTLAVDGMPSVYTIADMLQNESDIMEFLKNDRYQFPDPKKSIFHVSDENDPQNDGQQKPLPSHYKRGETGRSEFQSMNKSQMLRDDLSFVHGLPKRQATQHFKDMMQTRKSLPAWQMADEILKKLSTSPVVVISGNVVPLVINIIIPKIR